MEKNRPIHHPAEKRERKWTMEVMAGAIYAMKEAGLPINPGKLDAEHKPLLNAIVNYPGGYDGVLTAAGLDPDEERIVRNSRIRR